MAIDFGSKTMYIARQYLSISIKEKIDRGNKERDVKDKWLCQQLCDAL